MNFANPKSSKPDQPFQQPPGKASVRVPARVRVSLAKDPLENPSAPLKLGSFKGPSAKTDIKNSPEQKTKKKYETPVEPDQFEEDEKTPDPSIMNKLSRGYTMNPQKPTYDMSNNGKSQSSKPVRAKVNIGISNTRPQNIFSEDIKSHILKDIEKKKVEVESLIRDQPDNPKQEKKFDSKMRVRVLKQKSQEKKVPINGFEEIKREDSQLNDERDQITNRHYDYIERPHGEKADHNSKGSSLEELPSPDMKGFGTKIKSTMGSRKLDEDEEEKGMNQPKPRTEQVNVPKVKKGKFIINTRSSIVADKTPKDSENDPKMKGTTPRLIKLKSNEDATPTEERVGTASPYEAIRLQRSNVYAQMSEKEQNMKESLYSPEDMKRMSLTHKMKGNDYFKQGNQAKAIEEYSKAIKLYAKDSTYFSNRAVCYKMLLQWDKVIIDCELGIQLNEGNFKAFNLKGHALVELGKNEPGTKKVGEGIKSLEKAMEIYCQKGEVGDVSIKNELEVKLNKARKIQWLKEYRVKEKKSEDVADFVNKLISKDTKVKQELKFDPKEAFEMFRKEKESKEVKDIPEYLCCKITFDLMKDPIMTPYGIGYEKTVIYEHIKKNGHFDPVTRRQLPPQFLVPNKSLEKAIQGFIKQNPWAFEFISFDENYQQIAL